MPRLTGDFAHDGFIPGIVSMIVKVFPIPETPMNLVLQPWHLMVTIFLASWVNRHQQEVIEYLQYRKRKCSPGESSARSESCSTTISGRRLAVEGKDPRAKTVLDQDRHALHARHHPALASTAGRQAKWDYSDRKKKRQGRPRVRQVIVDLTLRFAKENPSMGLRPDSG